MVLKLHSKYLTNSNKSYLGLNFAGVIITTYAYSFN